MTTEKIFEAALGISSPWYIAGLNFEPSQKQLKIRVDFEVGSRFAVPGQSGEHPVHDTVTKTYRHLNFFQHECHLEVRAPRVKLPDGSVIQVSPAWAGKLSGFTLLFEAFVLLLCREMTFAGAARITGLSAYRVQALAEKYVNETVALAVYSEVRDLAIDETSRAKGHDYVTLFADADSNPARRRVLYVAEGREADTVKGFAANLKAHQGKPSEIRSISIDMSPAFISGVQENFPNMPPRR
jgi:transposase